MSNINDVQKEVQEDITSLLAPLSSPRCRMFAAAYKQGGETGMSSVLVDVLNEYLTNVGGLLGFRLHGITVIHNSKDDTCSAVCLLQRGDTYVSGKIIWRNGVPDEQ